jgi:hypothetical protein
MKIMEQPVKGRTWFEVCSNDRPSTRSDTWLQQIADQMFVELGGNADR